MQVVSSQFESAALSPIRSPIIKVEIAWDLINYIDETNYVKNISIERWADGDVFSVAQAIADIGLLNTNDRFTPGSTSPINGLIRSKRPVRISSGFMIGGVPNLITIFVGYIYEYPTIDRSNKTVELFCVDKLGFIWDNPVKNTEMFVNETADVIIEELLTTHGGIDPGDLDLDTGVNVIPFAYFEKDSKFGGKAKEIVEADLGRLFQDEVGVFRFISRDTWTREPYTTPVMVLEDVLTEESQSVKNVINATEVTGRPRVVRNTQKIWDNFEPIFIGPGATTTFFASFDDPAIDVIEPAEGAITSKYKAGYQADLDDSLATASLEVTLFTAFSQSAKITLKNNDTLPIYVTLLEIWGKPAVETDKDVQARYTDQDSIDEYGEQFLSINNNYIQSATFAGTLAAMIVEDRKELGDYKKVTTRAIPQLQLGDIVEYEGGDYQITSIKLKYSESVGFTQQLTIINRVINTYFRIGISTIGGDDKIGP